MIPNFLIAGLRALSSNVINPCGKRGRINVCAIRKPWYSLPFLEDMPCLFGTQGALCIRRCQFLTGPPFRPWSIRGFEQFDEECRGPCQCLIEVGSPSPGILQNWKPNPLDSY